MKQRERENPLYSNEYSPDQKIAQQAADMSDRVAAFGAVGIQATIATVLVAAGAENKYGALAGFSSFLVGWRLAEQQRGTECPCQHH